MSTKSFPTLYKRDNNKKIRVWDVSVVDHGDCAEIIVSHGSKGGAIQDKSTFIDEGKNIGRTNETNYFEQACSEAQSKWNKQIDKGYGESKTPQVVFLPMLAQRYDHHPKKLKFPAYVQPKLDGLRCTCSLEGNKVKFRSRQGKEFKVLDHLAEEVHTFLYETGIVLDGELYSDEITFQQIQSAVKRDEPNKLTDKIKFHYYDCYCPEEPKMTFEERWTDLSYFSADGFVEVDTYEINNENEITQYHSKFVNEGYEGSILRNKNGIYKVNGRSYDLLKLKDFDDDEFEITGAKEDKNGEAVFVCVTQKGYEFECKPKGAHEERVAMWKNRSKYIGKQLNIKYFGYTTTDKPVPRFPVGMYIREDN